MARHTIFLEKCKKFCISESSCEIRIPRFQVWTWKYSCQKYSWLAKSRNIQHCKITIYASCPRRTFFFGPRSRTHFPSHMLINTIQRFLLLLDGWGTIPLKSGMISTPGDACISNLIPSFDINTRWCLTASPTLYPHVTSFFKCPLALGTPFKLIILS